MWRSILFSLLLTLMIFGCGGGGGGSGDQPGQIAPPPEVTPVQNQLPIVIANNAVNVPFVSVTICSPGTNNCQTIDHIILDTGSSGLRIVSSALSPTLNLPAVQTGNSRLLNECMQFVSGYTWGAIRSADVKLAGHTLEALAIQVIDDTSTSSAPASCTSAGSSLSISDGNGILGVGVYAQDCGSSCARTAITGTYYACSGASCQPTSVALRQQVHNPVVLLSSDNNGVAVEFPAIASSGAISVNGTLTLGIGTQANNSLKNATVIGINANGTFVTNFGGTNYAGFIDSGSNSFFFPSNNIPVCAAFYSGFYCPVSELQLSATNTGTNGATSTINFQVDNANRLFSSRNTAFNNLAGAYATSGGYFDWGLPFFFGRKVFTAIEGQSTPGGIGPYVAY
jgi:hypothetical protein